ncbi:MAG: zinc-binding dehydrogenase, partial [Chloroflexi bacterium]|nr:zinc-binding dehydrogenase [Chloroflexota bacterium]
MRAVVFDGAGGNEVVQLVERPDPEPGPEDVVVAARFAGMNPADLHQRLGRYPAPPGAVADVPGLEVAGTVVAAGERVTAWGVGQRVFGLGAGGGLADRVLVHERCVTLVPERMSHAEAAATPEAFITAHDAVLTQAGLRPGETLLVHGASGAVGSAAVQIALAAGARVLGSVRSDDAAAVVVELGAEAVRDEDLAAAVSAATDRRGADVILELVGAPHFPANLEVLAMYGRIVVVGVGAGATIQLDLLGLMRRRAVMRGTMLRARPLEDKADAVRAFEREVVPMLADGRV